jgi:two-component system, cell cycle sensor histidine kinase and response regulator CckA
VKQSGGYVWVYSEVGLGSTFKVYLPVAGGAEYTPAVPVEEARPPTGHETVLVVEDEAVVRQLVKRGLEASGYTVIEAANGVQALALCAAGTATIHLVVTDVVMPGLGGRELVARLHEKHPALRVLYMSGYTDDGVVHHGVSNEEVAFIQKPFTIRALARKVRQVLDGR